MRLTSYLRLQRQLEEKLKKATESRREAEAQIDAAEKAIADARKLEASVDRALVALEEAKKAYASKEYTSAVDYALQAREHAAASQKERLNALIISAENAISITRGFGVDVSRVEEILAASKKSVLENEFERAIKLAEQCWHENEKLLRDYLAKAFSSAQALILFAKSNNIDTAKAEEFLQAARSAMNKDEFETAIHHIAECSNTLGTALSEQIKAFISEAEGVLSVLSPEDIAQFDRLKTLRESIDKDIAQKNFELAWSRAKETIVEAQRAVRVQVGSKIEALGSEIKNAEKLEADVTKARKILADIQASFRANDFKVCIQKMKSCREEIENAQFQRVLKTISESRASFVTAMRLGIDMKPVRELLDSARSALQKGNYEEALRIASNAREEVDGLIRSYQNTAGEIRRIYDLLSSAEQLGANVSVVKTILSDARIALEARDFKKASALVTDAQQTLDKLQYEKTMEQIEGSEYMLTAAEKLGVDVGQYNPLLQDAIAAVKNKEYKKAVDSAARYKLEVGKAIKERVTGIIDDASSRIAKIETEKEMDLSEPKHWLEEAKTALVNGEYERACGLSMQALEWVDKTQAGEAEKIHKYVTESVQIIKNLGGDTKISDELLAQARAAIERKEYSKSIELTDTALDELEKAEKKLAEELFFAAKLAVIEVKKTGFDITTLRETLRMAKSAIDSGDYRAALQHSADAKKNAEALKQEYEKTYDMMSGAAVAIAEAKKYNLDVTKAIERLLAARSEFEKYNYKRALEIATESREEAQRLLNRYHSAVKVISAQEKIALAERIGIDVTKARELLEKVQLAVKAFDYAQALELATQSDRIADETIRDSITFTISSAESLIINAKADGIAVERADEYLESAKAAMAAGRFEEAINFGRLAQDKIKFVSGTVQQLTRQLRLAEERITETEGLKFDMTEPKRILAEAKEAMNEKDYRRALELATLCIETIDAEQRKNILSLAGALQVSIDKYRIAGININQLQSQLIQARAALEVKNLKEAMNAITQVEGAIRKLDSQYETASKTIISTQTTLIEAEHEGINLPVARELLEKAKLAFSTGDYVNSLQLAVQAGNILHAAREQYRKATEILNALDTRIAELARYGIDTVKIAERVNTVRENVKAGEFERAIGIGEQVFGELEAMVKVAVDDSLRTIERVLEVCEKYKVEADAVKHYPVIIRNALDEQNLVRALALGREGGIEITKIMNKWSPKIIVNMSFTTDLKLNTWTEGYITITNTGRTPAKSVQVGIDGNIEFSAPHEIDEIGGNDMAKIPTRLKPLEAGELTLTIKVTARRVFDNKARTFEMPYRVKVLRPPALLERMPPAELKIPTISAVPGTCAGCTGKIKLHNAMIKCDCGREYHRLCAVQQTTCNCGSGLHPKVEKYLTDTIATMEQLSAKVRDCIEDKQQLEKIDEMRTHILNFIESANLEKALELARPVMEQMNKLLARASPNIALTIDVKPAVVNEWTEASVIIINTGKTPAKQLHFKLEGMESSELEPIPELLPGETRKLGFKIKSTEAGKQNLKFSCTVARIFDDKTKTFEVSLVVDVRPAGELKPPAALPPNVQRYPAIGGERCGFCMGRIFQSLMIRKCACGQTYHDKCGERKRVCICGQPLQ